VSGTLLFTKDRFSRELKLHGLVAGHNFRCVSNSTSPSQIQYRAPIKNRSVAINYPIAPALLFSHCATVETGTQVGALCSLQKLLIGEAPLPRKMVTRQHSLALSASRNLVRSSRVFLSA